MIPKAVQEQAARADALFEQLNARNTAVAAPAPAEPPPEPAPPAPAPAPVAVDDASWEHKYKALAGKYSAEVPRLAEELRSLKAELRDAQDKLANPPPPDLIVNKLTPEQVVEQFGEDFAGAVASILEQRVSKLRDEFRPQVEAATATAAKAARADFMRELSSQVPDWQSVDQDERFTAFLDTVDPLAGRSRREFFNEADQRNDAARIVSFFKTFRDAHPATPPVPSKSGIEYQLAPSSTRANDTPPGKKVWTQPEIRRFYVDVRRGLYSAQDMERIEQDIYAAQAEGRLLA